MATRGLVLLAQQDYAGVSSVSFDNVFSATYKQYKIIHRTQGAVTNAINMRMRASGSDNSSSNYNYQYIQGSNTTLNAARTTTTQFQFVGFAESGSDTISIIEILNPFQSTYTSLSTNRITDPTGSIQLLVASAGMTVTTSYDGFTLLPSAGTTLTGSCSVYGLAV